MRWLRDMCILGALIGAVALLLAALCIWVASGVHSRHPPPEKFPAAGVSPVAR
jgi:hypothetical protein